MANSAVHCAALNAVGMLDADAHGAIVEHSTTGRWLLSLDSEIPCSSPDAQAYVERFIQSVQQECTDHFIVCGERHFDYLVKEYVEHYHTERPHQSLGNVTLTP